MIYSNLIVNSNNWSSLTNLWGGNKLPNAFLFYGPQGSGKEGHAIELAALLNCKKSIKMRACGSCNSCKKTRSFQHENVKLILPFPRGNIKSSNDSIKKAFTNSMLIDYRNELSKKELDPYYPIHLNGANSILINSIREIKHDISLSTINNDWKIILIFNAEKLCIPSPESANALLKILEEPPKNTFFILTSSYPKAIIETIKSRCQKIYFSPIPNDIHKDLLIKSGINSDHAHLLANISSGNMTISNQIYKKFDDLITNLNLFIETCFSFNPILWNKYTDMISRLKNNDKKQMEQIFLFITIYFRDLLYYSSTNTHNEIIFTNQIKQISELTKKYNNANWDMCINQIEITQNYITRNAFMPLQMTCLFINLKQIINGKISDPFKLSSWIEI